MEKNTNILINYLMKILALICEGYTKEIENSGKERLVLKLKPELAPIKINILPLDKKNHSEMALKLYRELRKKLVVSYDDKGNIGKRYKNGDAIGTPLAICVDDDTLNNNYITIRERDTKEQIRVSIDQVENASRKLLRR